MVSSGTIFWLGLLTAIGGGVRLIMHAFNTHLAWGIGCLVFPALLLAFGFAHWDETKKPTLVFIAGLAAMLMSTRL